LGKLEDVSFLALDAVCTQVEVACVVACKKCFALVPITSTLRASSSNLRVADSALLAFLCTALLYNGVSHGTLELMKNEFDVLRLIFRFGKQEGWNNVIVALVAKIEIAGAFAGVVSHDLIDSLAAYVAIDQLSALISSNLLGRHQAQQVASLTVLVLRNAYEWVHRGLRAIYRLFKLVALQLRISFVCQLERSF
jgi:hypothetical protein